MLAISLKSQTAAMIGSFQKTENFPLAHVIINDFDKLQISGYVQ